MKNRNTSHWLLLPLLLGGALVLLASGLLSAARGERATVARLGYGFNVAAPDVALIEEMGFDWIKVFSPPATRWPVRVLLRIDAHAQDLDDLTGFGATVGQIAAGQGAFIEAYEIGNEVNLGVDFGWNGPPVAADYVALLCEAHAQIKAVDPEAVVVSAGLAPTGRITGDWDGHAGHDGQNQDEREYLDEFLAAGGAACADAIGYHPYGFSADYDAPPDITSVDPALNCENGFCFRGAEVIHDLLVTAGEGDVGLWATEFGWIVRPPDYCLSDPSFAGREWQLVSEEKQAQNLVGAFRYAREHWPWMDAMFVFNLNFNAPGWYPECDQIRYYAVEGRPAEDALRDELAKDPAELKLAATELTILESVAAQPFTVTRALYLRNVGGEPLVYSATVQTNHGLLVSLTPTHGIIPAHQQLPLSVTVQSSGRPAGIYSGTIRIEAAAGALATPATMIVSLRLLDDVRRNFLPLLRRPGTETLGN